MSDILFEYAQLPNHHYRTEIPNIIRELGLSPYELATYFHIKSITGDAGKCWSSNKKLSKNIGIGETKLRNSLDNLVEGNNKLKLKLLTKTFRKKDDGSLDTCVYTIIDIWQINGEYFRQKFMGGTSRGEVGVPRNTREGTSPREDKEEPSQEEPNEEDGKSSSPPKNSQIKRDLENLCFSPITQPFIRLLKDAYPHVDIEMEIKRAYIKASNMEPRACWKAFITNWCKAEESNYLHDQATKLSKEANKEKLDQETKLSNENYTWAKNFYESKCLQKTSHKSTWTDRYVQISYKGKLYHADFIEDDFKPKFRHIITLINQGNT